MKSPLTGSLALSIGKALGPIFLPAMLTRDVPQTGGDPADPLPPIPADFPCQGMVEKYGVAYRAGGLVEDNDRKVLVLATSLGVKPKPGDRVTISAVTFTVISVSTDPATAVWELQGRM